MKVLFQHHISSHEVPSFQEIIQEVEGVVKQKKFFLKRQN